MSLFDAAELPQALDDEAFEEREGPLRERLLAAQLALKEADFPVIVVISGMEGSGKGELLHRLLEWLDARGVEAHALRAPTDEERERPRAWRWWRRLPPAGRIGLFLGSWYTELLFAMRGKKARDERERVLDDVVSFERLLADEGALLVKLYLHVTKRRQKERFRELEGDPDTRWRVTKQDWRQHGRYAALRERVEDVIARTSAEHAPWDVVSAADGHRRDVDAAERLAAALEERLARPAKPAPPPPAPPAPAETSLLRALDLTREADADAYERELDELQGELGRLARGLRDRGRSLVVALEGPDASGKGGAIRRVTRALDARWFKVHPISAPSEEERAHPWLWRFWRRVPRCGDVALFDRSWYGRVLVERVEGYCAPEDWKRAFREIVEFEDELVAGGAVVVKLWLWIDPDEQLRRFEAREETGWKRYKITPDDWRNREKWDAYEAAACEAFERTSTSRAPWKLVAANDKRWARLEVLRTLVAAIG